MPLAATLWFCSLALAFPQEPTPPATPSPKAEPPRIVWQRTLDDALAAQQASGLPLLVVVNDDGETFNDRFATTVYRDPEFVALTEGWICVVASLNRHNPFDHDERGRRIECPRFPGCTCSEHMAIEPLLYEKWFKGQRYAPRHIGVTAAGKVLFDRFLDASMQTAIDAVKEHRGTARPGSLEATDDLAQLFARRDAAARLRVEQRYRQGARAEREAVLRAAATAAAPPIDLLREALRSGDAADERLVATALAAFQGVEVRQLAEDLLARSDDAGVQSTVRSLLKQLGASDPVAKRLAAHLEAAPDVALPAPWSNAWSPAGADANDRDAVERWLDQLDKAVAERPDDAPARLQQAIADLMLAQLLIQEGGKGVELWLEEAQRAAGRVQDAGLAPEAAAVRAVAAWWRNDAKAANEATAVALSTATGERRPDAWLARTFLDTLVAMSTRWAYERLQADPQAEVVVPLARVLQATSALASHDALGEPTATQAATLYDVLGLRHRARSSAAATLARFPGSLQGHHVFRTRLLADFDTARLRAAYDAFLQEHGDRADAAWYAGYAELMIAEVRVREKDGPAARAAYEQAIARFSRSIEQNPDFADNSNHFVVLALAGRAIVRFEAGDDEGAVDDLLRAASLRPASLDQKDGLGRDPRGLILRVARTLKTNGKKELAKRLEPLLP